MAFEKRPQATKFQTPVGTAIFPKLNAPDTKFKADGEYGVKLRLGAAESEAFIAKIEKELKAYWPVAKAELEKKLTDAVGGPAKAKAKLALSEMKEADKSFKPAYDDEGEETGEYEFNFKMPATYLKDKGKTTEKRLPMRPDLFDAKGKKLDSAPEVWGGSRLIVAGEFRPFSTTVGVGISLRLKAAQIIELVLGGGNRDAASYGFGQQEGFEGSNDPTMADHAPAAEDSTPAGGDENF